MIGYRKWGLGAIVGVNQKLVRVLTRICLVLIYRPADYKPGAPNSNNIVFWHMTIIDYELFYALFTQKRGITQLVVDKSLILHNCDEIVALLY